MTVQDFISQLGGAAKVARETGIPLTTIASWGQRGKVPHWRVPTLVALAVRNGIAIPSDLVVAA